nr:unnamed protein product [Callosobruchus analis]
MSILKKKKHMFGKLCFQAKKKSISTLSSVFSTVLSETPFWNPGKAACFSAEKQLQNNSMIG